MGFGFAVAATIKYHRPASPQKCTCSQPWSLDAQDQGVGRGGVSLLRPLSLARRWPSSPVSSAVPFSVLSSSVSKDCSQSCIRATLRASATLTTSLNGPVSKYSPILGAPTLQHMMGGVMQPPQMLGARWAAPKCLGGKGHRVGLRGPLCTCQVGATAPRVIPGHLPQCQSPQRLYSSPQDLLRCAPMD